MHTSFRLGEYMKKKAWGALLPLNCHSEQSEESNFIYIFRFAQDDNYPFSTYRLPLFN